MIGHSNKCIEVDYAESQTPTRANSFHYLEKEKAKKYPTYFARFLVIIFKFNTIFINNIINIKTF